MMYRIEDKKEKDWNGQKRMEATLVDEKGVRYEKVSAWNGEFVADTWYGELEKNDKGYWKLVKPKNMFPPRTPRISESERQGNIEKNMDKKEESIAWFNSRNTAIEFVKAFYAHPSIVSPSEALMKIREYTEIFFKDWKNREEKDTPFGDSPF